MEPFSLGWKFLFGLITTRYDSEQDLILLAHSEHMDWLHSNKKNKKKRGHAQRCRTEKTADIWETSYVQDYLADYDPTRA